MKIIYPTMACFLHIGLSGCMDYVKLEDDSTLGESYRFAPVIDAAHISPHPLQLVETIGVGKKCRGMKFRVPPIEDRNKNERLYYYWFLDNKLAAPEATIEPEYRKSAVIAFEIDQQFLLSHFESRIPGDFFNRLHVIGFFVSDVKYTIPESRYPDDAQKNNEDYVYWIVSFSNDPCS